MVPSPQPPIDRAPPDRDPPHPREAGPDTPGATGRLTTLLVVDDDPRVLEVVRRMLDGAGYRVLTATDGDDALERIAREPPDRPVDLVLCDVLMPGKEGLETCAMIARRHPAIRVVVMSGALRADSYLEMALKLGAAGRLSKPFDRRELIDTLTAALASRG